MKNILIIQETAWAYKGPTVQHHLFERISQMEDYQVTIVDYDIYKTIKSDSKIIPKKIVKNFARTVKGDVNIEIITSTSLRIPFFSRISSLIANFFDILRIIRKNKPSVIVIYSITNGSIGVILAKLFRIPIIFHYLDILHELIPIEYAKSFARVITKFILKNVDYIYTTSEGLKRYVINESVPAEKVEFINYGISLDFSMFDQKKMESLNKVYNIQKEDLVILFMGALYDFAGLEKIVDYFNDKVLNTIIVLLF